MKYFLGILWVVLLYGSSCMTLYAQEFPYSVELKAKQLAGLPGLHSYAFAQHEGKWLIIGGRLDGIHARQPVSAFPQGSNNTLIYVVDPTLNQVRSTTINSLSSALKEQLQSTNMCFHQDADTLYFVGGYGFSASANNHVTYPNLISISVSGLMSAIINNHPIVPCFKQIQDPIFAVTGGHLDKLNGLFYLVGGHRFDGRYNPMGGPTFTQAYSNQIRKFTLNNSGSQLSYGNYAALTDAVHLHRRDYNLIPQIFPNGEEGFTISSGVFQVGADVPFLYPVDISATGYTPIPTFNQYLSNYHCANVSMHDANLNAMHTLFFGGISQYYYQNGNLIQDNQVPFVNTISRLSRDANNVLTEHQLPTEMPSLKGAGAEFIVNPTLSQTASGILEMNNWVEDSLLIGYIFGGITSTARNPFASNQTQLTQADPTLYEVWLKRQDLGLVEPTINGRNPFEVTLYPNPSKRNVFARFALTETTDVRYLLTDLEGKIIDEAEYEPMTPGEHEIKIGLKNNRPSILFLHVIFDNKFYVSQQIITE